DRHERHDTVNAHEEQPNVVALFREEDKSNREALTPGTDRPPDNLLHEQTDTMLPALDLGEFATPHLEAIDQPKKPVAEMSKPSAETIQLAQASTEEVDAELLGIFLEEANEVLGTIDEALSALVGQPHNIELLTTIRRSFHTLKGSGRMVGLKDVGEAAWAVEQTLNQWLRQELEVSTPIFDLIGQAHAVFTVWVQHLESSSGKAPDPSNLIAFAESLRHNADEPPPAGTAPKPIGTSDGTTENTAAAETTQSSVSTGLSQQHEAAPPTETIALDFETGTNDSDGNVREVEPITDHSKTVNLAVDGQLEKLPESASAVVPQPTTLPPLEEVPRAAVVEMPLQPRISVSPTLYEIFSEEAGTHLATLKRELHVLESDEFAPTSHAMCRAAHTLGGISATVGIKSVNQLGLALEHALMRRDGSEQVCDPESLKVIRQAVDAIDLSLVALAGQREPEISSELIAALDILYPAHAPHHDVSPETVPSIATDGAPEATLPLDAVKPALDQVAGFETEAPKLRDEIDDQLLPIFLEEAVDLNEGIAAQLRAWRSAPDNTEAVRILTRLLHTLKGSARMAGAMNLGEITHTIETRVEQASRAGSAPLEVIDEIDNAFDDVLQIIERLQRGESLDQAEEVPTAELPPVVV
ncbi:MAG TPA: Hpt domain-containing protein, partial [Candidatus Paceibacterota bacterium]|nr:Hpt domain-containing protein [Candidatus Paceibacterota bacterium]